MVIRLRSTVSVRYLLVAAFSGTNLFHGGHPNDIVNALLPGIGVVEHLSNNVP